MLLVGVVGGVEAVVLAQEPLHRELNHFDAPVEVLGDAVESLHAKLGDIKVLAVASGRDGLEDLLEVLLGGLDHLGVFGSDGVLDFRLQHHRKVPAVLIDIVVPVDHRLESALDALHHAVRQELIVIREQGRGLLWLHGQRAAKSIQDELKGALRVARVPVHIHRHDVHAVFDWLLLRGLEAAPALALAVEAREILLACPAQVTTFPVVSPVVLEAENVGIAGNSLDVLLDSHEEAANFFRVTCHVQALDVIFDDDSDFLQK